VSIGLAVALVGLTMLALAILLVPLLLRRQRAMRITSRSIATSWPKSSVIWRAAY
jgi:hypothetical protein